MQSIKIHSAIDNVHNPWRLLILIKDGIQHSVPQYLKYKIYQYHSQDLMS